MAGRREALRQCAFLLALAPVLTSPAEARDDPAAANQIATYRKTAEDLYEATAKDARTFEQALVLPEVRRDVERVFKRKLSDPQLEAMAVQAKAEADYWNRYLEGLN
ncbi:MAG: hypothetical protein WA417_14875, partial [Stellaceae bacterium]